MIRLTTWFTISCVMERKSNPFGKKKRNRSFVFSFVPCCQGLCGSAKINSGGRNWLSVWVEQVPTTGNGLRRPAAVQPGNNEVPFLRAGLQCTVYSLSGAVNSEILHMPMVVPILIIRLAMRFSFSLIPFDLTGDGRGAALQSGCNFPQAMTFCQKLL